MGTGVRPRIGEVSPIDAWRILEDQKSSVLVDVRTRAEWGFVGQPDLEGLAKTLLSVEWASYPGMSKTPHFAEAVLKELGDEIPETILFLCRSGVRSLLAAEAVADALSNQGKSVTCLNVSEGFEGDLDSAGHRGVIGGWKARGLAWRQT